MLTLKSHLVLGTSQLFVGKQQHSTELQHFVGGNAIGTVYGLIAVLSVYPKGLPRQLRGLGME